MNQQNWYQDDPPGGPVPPVRKSGSSTWIIVVAAVGGVAILCLLACGGLVWWGIANNPEARDLFGLAEDLPPRVDEPLDEKRSALVAAFEAEEKGIDEKTLREVDALFGKIVEASQTDDARTARRAVDLDRYVAEVKRAGTEGRVGYLDQLGIRQRFAEGTVFDEYFDSHAIVRAEPVPDTGGNELLVHAVLACQVTPGEMRWWLVRKDGVWKAYDWEFLDRGMRESTWDAHTSVHGFDPGMIAYEQCIQDWSNGIGRWAEGDVKGAAVHLARAEKRACHPSVADEARLRIAYGWMMCDQPRRAIAAARRISDPDRTPGAWYAARSTRRRRRTRRRAVPRRVHARDRCGAAGGIRASVPRRDVRDRAPRGRLSCRSRSRPGLRIPDDRLRHRR
ncbi:MAG: hypothetical protein WD069_00930 [Planctomycetales bacterium]